MTLNPFAKSRLFCPGPTPVPLSISAAALETDVYHRTEAFRKIMMECCDLLKPFFGSQSIPLILASSGTGALEASLVNLTSQGDKILVLNGGKFGERWEKLGKAYGCEVISYEFPWGEAPQLDNIRQLLLEHRDIKAVFFQANETSTGVAYPVQEIAALVQSVSSALICVDAVSALVAHKMDMEAWGIDAVMAGSQKGFGIPPGLSFICLSKKAWANLSSRPRFYFDLAREQKGQLKGETAWTPATSLILSLRKALDRLGNIGPENCDLHHRIMAKACRDAAQGLGLSLFAQSHYSQALTAVCLPREVDGSTLIRLCREDYGVVFAPGQDQLKGKIVRISHLGMVDQLDLMAGLSALEMALFRLGHKHTLGKGVAAAVASFVESSSHSVSVNRLQ